MSQLAPPTTKQRTSVACSWCRSKRVKCDGVHPTCNVCINSGRSCEYLHDQEKRKPPSKKYVQALVSRIDSLEDELAKYRQARPQGAAGSSQTPQHPNIPKSPLNGNKSDPVDDLGDLLGRLTVADDGNITYFGPRSNFLTPGQEVHRAWIRSAEPLQVQPRTDTNLSLEIQEHLLEYFWVWQNPWNYLVHKKRFFEEYQLPGGKYCSDVLLTAVLAIAARYSDYPEVRVDPLDPSTAGKYHADKAKAIIFTEMESPTVSTIAATCLMSMWEMAVDKDSLGWIYIGMASRMAFNLGLHLDCSDLVQSGKISAEDAEIRNITWWGLYTLEKLFNIGFGRPSTIPERDIATPLPSLIPDVEYEAWSPISSLENPHSSPTQISFAISSARHTCKIFRITSETMDTLSAASYRASRPEQEALVAKTYVELAKFYNDLPSSLRLPVSTTKSLPAHVYLMHIQYHVAVIQLHRPFIRRRSPNALAEMLSADDYSHNQACSSSAEAISTIIRAYRLHYSLRRVAISAVHAIGTSATIHLFDATTPDPLLQRKAARLFRFNFSCLQEMSVAFVWSKRTMRALQLIAKHWALDEPSKEVTKSPQVPETRESRQISTTEGDEVVPFLAAVSAVGALDGDSMFADMDWMLSYDLGEGIEGDLTDLDLSLWEFNQNFT